MIIKIKRATTCGLVDAEGYFFEEKGMQFCLVRDEDEGLYYSIHLPTGFNVKAFELDEYSFDDALKLSKSEISTHSTQQWDDAIARIADYYCHEYNFSIPVNEPIKSDEL